VRLQPGSARLLQALCRVRVQGQAQIVATAEGRVLASNPGDRAATIAVDGGAAVRLRPGGCAVLR